MNKFTVRDFSDNETQSFLRGVFSTGRCVPFLGAGFTRGEPSKEGCVPDGNSWKGIMIDSIIDSNHPNSPSREDLEELNFQDLSEEFFHKEYVDIDIIKKIVEKEMSSVRIEDSGKKEFLNLGWPYIYTLNIDDGIENSSEFKPVTPCREFNFPEGTKYLIKLHGDVGDVISAANRDNLNVVFSSSQYIKSIKNNSYVMSVLSNDFCEKHFLFIGCSLVEEIDIAYSLASAGNTQKTSRIYVTTRAPQKRKEEINLERYGITDVIVISDYAVFYSFCRAAYSNALTSEKHLDRYKINNSNIPQNTNTNIIKYVTQSGWRSVENPYNLSITRKIEASIIEKISSPIIIIWGARFSGKSTVLRRVIHSCSNRNGFFVGSSSTLSVSALTSILKIKDAVIGIDTNVLSFEQIHQIKRRIDEIGENNTTIILALNKYYSSQFDSIANKNTLEIKSNLNDSESELMDSLLAPLGLAKWRRHKNILDNIYLIAQSPIYEAYATEKSKLIEIINRNANNKIFDKKSELEFMVLFYISVKGKIFSRIYRALTLHVFGSSYNADILFDEFVRSWGVFVEERESDFTDLETTNSSKVIFSNSSAWIAYAVKKIAEKCGKDLTATYISQLYRCVQNIDTDPFDLVMFDNLNIVFDTVGDIDFSGWLIREIYKKLASTLHNDPDYWLQRSKAIYYISSDLIEIKLAISFIEKGIDESHKRSWINAKLTKANLLGKYCYCNNYEDKEYLRASIRMYYELISNPIENHEYIKELISKSKYGDSYLKKVYEASIIDTACLDLRHELREIGREIQNHK